MKREITISDFHYQKGIITVPWKLIIGSFILFIIVISFIVFTCSFDCYSKYVLYEKEKGVYQIIIPYHDLSLWKQNSVLKYQKEEYSYTVQSIEKEPIYQDNSIYYSLLITAKDIPSMLYEVIDVTILKDKVTIYEYLKNKVIGEE